MPSNPLPSKKLQDLYHIRDELEDKYAAGDRYPLWLETYTLSDIYRRIQEEEMEEWQI